VPDVIGKTEFFVREEDGNISQSHDQMSGSSDAATSGQITDLDR
jgi:hypothetical protein